MSQRPTLVERMQKKNLERRERRETNFPIKMKDGHYMLLRFMIPGA